MQTHIDLPSQIKAARVRLGLSQSQAAKAWGTNIRNIQNWEQGIKVPESRTLLRLLPILSAPRKPSASSRP